jgi:hypothetical protein
MTYNVELSTEQVQRFAPSAFAVTPYHKQSSRYAFIPTSAVIDGMRDAGFLPVSASQSRTRIEDKKEYTKHMIRFRAAASLQQSAVVGESVLEAVLINSHDGTSAYKLMCGIFRFICTNGMIVADDLLESINVRHTGNVIAEVTAGSNHILEAAPKIMEVIDSWKNITLASAEQQLLAEGAHALRFPINEETGLASTLVTPEMLLKTRRHEDASPSLWNTFNRIQENTLQGFKTSARGRRITARAVRSIDGDVKLNRALWTLATRMAELKQA